MGTINYAKKLLIALGICALIITSACASVNKSSPNDAQKNPYVEERLSEKEKTIYYKDPIQYVEKLALEDSNTESTLRALELSLYYQGWKPELVFFRFSKDISPNLLAIPTKTQLTQTHDLQTTGKKKRKKQRMS